jgi:hypothetical protein
MRDPRELNAFRLSDTLQMELYRTTDTFPADADEDLVTGLRFTAAAVSRHVLRGCGGQGDGARHSFRGAMEELDALGALVDVAEGLGYLRPDAVLELLETQTALLMQLILITQEVEEAPARVRAA